MNPVDIFGDFAAQALGVVPWVAAAVASAVGLAFVLIGIKKGFGFFVAVVNRDGTDGPRRSFGGGGAARRAWADDHDSAYDAMLDAGFSDDQASAFGTDFADAKARGVDHKAALKYAENRAYDRDL